MTQGKESMPFARWGVVAIVVCTVGCACIDRHDPMKRLDLEARIARFFRENDPNKLDVTVEHSAPPQLNVYEDLNRAVVIAIRDDTRSLPGPLWPGLAGWGGCMYVMITVQGEIESLIIDLDVYGFGIGARGDYRIVNRDLARCVEDIMRRSGVSEEKYWPMYEGALKRAAGDVSPFDEVPEGDAGPSSRGASSTDANGEVPWTDVGIGGRENPGKNRE